MNVIVEVLDLFSNPQESAIKLENLQFEPKFIVQQDFRWDDSCPGPRKRLSSNSEPIFYAEKVFWEFFMNPCYDTLLEEGWYQFAVISKTFQKEASRGLKLKQGRA